MKLPALLVAMSLSLPLLFGCGRTVTPAELEQYEQHAYAGQSRANVFKATVTALKTLGYEVVVADAATGKVKTAPKVVVVTAVRTSSSHAVASDRSVAWTIDVSGSGDGAQVHAEPRLSSAGQAIPPERLNQEYADRMFATLYSEIDDNLPGATTTTSAPQKRR